MEFEPWLNWWWLVGLPTLVAVSRVGSRLLRSPGTPSIMARLWRRLLTLGDLLVENQRLTAKIAVQDALIETLLHDLARASGIASSPGSSAMNPSIQHPSHQPTPPLAATSTSTTTSETVEEWAL